MSLCCRLSVVSACSTHCGGVKAARAVCKDAGPLHVVPTTMGKRRATPEAGPAVESGTTEQKSKGRTSTARMDDATPTKPYTFAAGAFNKASTVADAEIGSLFTGDAVAPVRLAPTAAGGSTPRGSKRRKVGAGATASMAEGVTGGAGVDDDEDRVIRRGSKADKSRNLVRVHTPLLTLCTPCHCSCLGSHAPVAPDTVPSHEVWSRHLLAFGFCLHRLVLIRACMWLLSLYSGPCLSATLLQRPKLEQYGDSFRNLVRLSLYDSGRCP